MSDAGAAQQAHARLQAILKAVVVGQDVSDPASREAGESTTLFSSAGALEYPAGREPITERTLRRLLESLVWVDQRALWAELRAVAG